MRAPVQLGFHLAGLQACKLALLSRCPLHARRRGFLVLLTDPCEVRRERPALFCFTPARSIYTTLAENTDVSPWTLRGIQALRLVSRPQQRLDVSPNATVNSTLSQRHVLPCVKQSSPCFTTREPRDSHLPYPTISVNLPNPPNPNRPWGLLIF